MSTEDHHPTDQLSQPAEENKRPEFGLPHPYRVDHAKTPPELTARLEWLDDLMFAAIDGDPVALETAIDAWRKTRNDLGVEVIEESRRQYLRRAQSVWNDLRQQPNHPPHKVFAAIEIISLLSGKAW